MRWPRMARSVVAVLAAASALIFIAPAAGSRHAADPQPVKVMSYNLFQGSELSHIMTVKSLSQVPAAAAADYQNVINSNIPARAQAIAAEIQSNRPDLVGLQEAVLWRTQPPPSDPFNVPGTAKTVSYDFVSLLTAALSQLGLHYRAVAITDNVDVQVNAAFPNGQQMGVRFTDRVAILARQGVKISDVRDKNFKARDAVNLLSLPLAVPDGYASVDATVGHRTIRFITTHLDGLNDKHAARIRAEEAKEILGGPANTSLPVVLSCDCNATATSSVHRVLSSGRLRDEWHALNPHSPGLTCCHRDHPGDPETDVADPSPTQGIVERIDYIWTSRAFRALAEKTLGLNPSDRTNTTPALWPSDHLGLFARLTLG